MWVWAQDEPWPAPTPFPSSSSSSSSSSSPSPSDSTSTSPQISVAVGVIVGLLASFVQSLGLAIQRKSHLANDALPPHKRRRDRKRPLWLLGFLIFLASNLFGTIFQLGALPIIVLGPLGAVSLLWNAFFAKFILGGSFSIHIVAGIILIAGGAFVPEQTHTLPELVALYTRTPFLIWATLLSIALASTLTLAHITEWALERRIASKYPDAPPLTPKSIRSSSELRRFTSRRESEGSPRSRVGSASRKAAALGIRMEGSVSSLKDRTNGNGNEAMTLDLRGVTFKDGTLGGTDEVHRIVLNGSALDDEEGRSPRVEHEARHVEPISSARKTPRPIVTITPLELDSKHSTYLVDVEAAIERSRLILGVAYGAASGTLSGLCLLFAKTGIELLIQTIVARQNQFGHFEAWAVVGVLAVAAVCQLFYLNRALRLVGPTLICPLAFCFYNLSSIISGLIYYDQWDQLTSLQFGLVALGTAILLGGVWILSIRSEEEQGVDDLQHRNQYQPILSDEPGCCSSQLEEGRQRYDDEEIDADDEDVASDAEDDLLDLDDDALSLPPALPLEWIPRGLTIGLGAASPGFDLRPANQRASQSVHHVGGAGNASVQEHRRKTSLPTIPFHERVGEGGDEAVIRTVSRSVASIGTEHDKPSTPTTCGSTSLSTPNSPRRRTTHSSNPTSSMTRSERAMSLSGNFYVGRFGPLEDDHISHHQRCFSSRAAAQARHRLASGGGLGSPTATTTTSGAMRSGTGVTDEEATSMIAVLPAPT